MLLAAIAAHYCLVLMYITSLLFLSLVIMWILDPKSAFTIPLVILLFTLLSLLVWRLLILRRRSF